MNRLTITLPDDLYAMARAHAVANRKSISKAIGDLLRQGRGVGPLPAAAPQPDSHPRVHPLSGFPVIEMRDGVTMEDIRRSMDDEDVRHLELMGLDAAQIQQALDQ
jgi:hypothetical protein